MRCCELCGKPFNGIVFHIEGLGICFDCGIEIDQEETMRQHDDHYCGDDASDWRSSRQPELVKCGCSNGYTGPAGDTCFRCEGSGWREDY